MAIALAYFVGGAPVGVLIGKTRGVDIRRVGSGNIGASNVMRVLGVKLGLLAFAGDVLKGALPVLIAQHVLGLTDELGGWVLPACGVAAVLGHCYSPYLRFAGGKAVATGLGIILAIQWQPGLACLAIWIATVALTRYISVASMVAYGLSPLVVWAFGGTGPTMGMAGFLALVSIYRHRDNLGRLFAGTESRIGQRVKAPADPPEGGTGQ